MRRLTFVAAPDGGMDVYLGGVRIGQVPPDDLPALLVLTATALKAQGLPRVG